MGGKAATCERLYMFPVCTDHLFLFGVATHYGILLLISLCHSLSLSVAVTATLLPLHSLSPLSVTTLCLGTTAITASARHSNKQEGLPCHWPPTPFSLTGGGEGRRQGRGMRRSESQQSKSSTPVLALHSTRQDVSTIWWQVFFSFYFFIY